MLLFLMNLALAGARTHDDDWSRFISGMAAGDENALAGLYDASSRLVYSIVLRIVGDPADADEVAQDVYSQAWRLAKDYSSERGSPASWLVMMARSRALDRVRSRDTRRQKETALEEVAEAHSSEDPPEIVVQRSQIRGIVKSALASLAPEQREAIEMAFFLGLTHSELAGRLGQPLGTVKTRIRLGMNKLRDALALGGVA